MMPSLIVRLYETEQRAKDAVTKLKEADFAEGAVMALLPGSASALSSAIKAGQMMGHLAGFYADRVEQGRSLVAVQAPFGQGELATDILDSCGPVDTDLKLPVDPSEAEWGRGAPFSAALGWSVLSRNNPSPLSDGLGIRTLSRCRFFLTSKLAPARSSLSGALGIGLLSQKAAPLSSAVGMSLLSRNAAPLSSTFGMGLLSKKAAPLSSLFGMSLLSRNPAPLSSLLGLRLLTARQ